MEEKDIIAYNISFYRKKLGLSQLELAERLQYSNKNISKWEKGETTPSIFTLKRLSEIFSISVDQLTSQVSDDSDIKLDSTEQKKPTSFKIKLVYLLMANAILLIVAFAGIWLLELLKVTTFNKWLLLLYTTPLSSLSVVIFIRCIFKRVDYISISFIVWLTALSVFATFYKLAGINYVFLLAIAIQLLLVCIAVLVNFHLIAKFKNKVFKKNKDDNPE